MSAAVVVDAVAGALIQDGWWTISFLSWLDVLCRYMYNDFAKYMKVYSVCKWT